MTRIYQTSRLGSSYHLVSRDAFKMPSSGYSPNLGWVSTYEGVLINLQKLKTIHINEVYNFASVRFGARWGEVYA